MVADKVHCYEDSTPGAWDAFITAMRSGQQFECDEEMFMYWLEVLPPVYMNKTVTLPDGKTVQALFGFAEGYELVTAFWRTRIDGTLRYFGCKTTLMNPRA